MQNLQHFSVLLISFDRFPPLRTFFLTVFHVADTGAVCSLKDNKYICQCSEGFVSYNCVSVAEQADQEIPDKEKFLEYLKSKEFLEQEVPSAVLPPPSYFNDRRKFNSCSPLPFHPESLEKALQISTTFSLPPRSFEP